MAIQKFISGFIGGKTSLVVTSPFGAWRKTYQHQGIDIRVASGSLLRSPVYGVVEHNTLYGFGGLTVKIKTVMDGRTFYFLFMHLHSVNVTLGQIIGVGTVLGTTGGDKTDKPNCGRSTGSHLHVGIVIGTNYYDPAPFFIDNLSTTDNKPFYGSINNAQKNDTPFVLESDLISLSLFNHPNTKIDKLIDYNATEEVIEPKKDTNFNERLAPGIWQIIKLLIDSSVSDKQVISSDINLQQGSLLSFFRKVCQEPLVELMSDTYGSLFYFIVRRPPTDFEGISNMLNQGAVINITDDEIINGNIDWYKDGGYSWYQFLPQAEINGMKYLTLYAPAVFFSEYAAIWGSKSYIIQSNYYSYKESGKYNDDLSENSQNKNNQISSAIKDFKYLIESNAYLPFTREGVIVIKLNRKIKKGMFLEIPTGEIFHIDSVTHNTEITKDKIIATTTVNISRGMMKEFVFPKKTLDDDLISYFKLIDFNETEEINFSNWRSIVSKWKVNPNVFSFFLTRQQLNYQGQQFKKVELYAGDIKTSI